VIPVRASRSLWVDGAVTWHIPLAWYCCQRSVLSGSEGAVYRCGVAETDPEAGENHAWTAEPGYQVFGPRSRCCAFDLRGVGRRAGRSMPGGPGPPKPHDRLPAAGLAHLCCQPARLGGCPGGDIRPGDLGTAAEHKVIALSPFQLYRRGGRSVSPGARPRSSIRGNVARRSVARVWRFRGGIAVLITSPSGRRTRRIQPVWESSCAPCAWAST